MGILHNTGSLLNVKSKFAFLLLFIHKTKLKLPIGCHRVTLALSQLNEYVAHVYFGAQTRIQE